MYDIIIVGSYMMFEKEKEKKREKQKIFNTIDFHTKKI